MNEILSFVNNDLPLITSIDINLEDFPIDSKDSIVQRLAIQVCLFHFCFKPPSFQNIYY